MLRHFLGDQYYQEMTKALLLPQGRTNSCIPQMGVSGKSERGSVVTDTHTSSAANKDPYKTVLSQSSDKR